MKMILIWSILMFLCLFSYSTKACADAAAAAVFQQTAVQTIEHLNQLRQMIQTVQSLQAQLSSMKNLEVMAQNAAQGNDGMQVITDFRNVLLQTNDVIRDVQNSINTSQDVSGQWQKMFGTLNPWLNDTKNTFSNIDVSDKVNSSGYLIADSYQKLYEKNSQSVAQFIENARGTSEKGALKQIAEEVAHLIEMENNTVYLLSQILKGQSIENSNENLVRKQQVAQFEQENQGIRDFMSMVDDKTFGI